MIDALDQGSRNCMEDIRKAGLPFFTSVLDEVPPLKVKRRKVEISSFVQVDYIEKEDDLEDLSEEEDLTYDDQVEEVDQENTVPTPFGHLPHSQADRIHLNAGGVRLNNISRKGRVASKSRRRLFHETAFSAYLTPEKCCREALTRGDTTRLWKCVQGKASNDAVRGTVRFMSKNLIPVSIACPVHDKEVNIWLFDEGNRKYIRCVF